MQLLASVSYFNLASVTAIVCVDQYVSSIACMTLPSCTGPVGDEDFPGEFKHITLDCLAQVL